jgi:hypothetical protein
MPNAYPGQPMWSVVYDQHNSAVALSEINIISSSLRAIVGGFENFQLRAIA